MKALMCVVLGDGSTFVVDIDDRKKVAHLKKLIKEENEATIKCDAKDLTLYVAKKGDNWVKTGDPDMMMLENGEVPKGIHDIMRKKENKMDPRYRIANTAFDFPDENDAEEDEIHVLVAVPGQKQTGSASNKEPHPTRKRRWDKLNEILDSNKKAKIKDGESSTGYSYMSFKDVNEIMPADPYEQATKTIGDATIDLLYAYLLVVTKAFGEVTTGTEAKRLHFIAPVLASVCALFDGHIEILAEESVVGKRVHGDGKFEFVIKRGNKRVCIVEAKKNDMEQGLAQAYLASEVLCDIEGLSTVYNVVTNYKDWCFSRVMDEKVERDDATMKFAHSIPTRESVKEIAEKIYALLSESD